jgi:hypothetical protein
MNASEYQSWMERAFLFVEAALAHEMATPSRTCMTEEYFRTSLVRGLANSMPQNAMRVTTEEDAHWGSNACWKNGCGQVPGQGRPIQHDVAVKPDPNDGGLLCEVKWLKAANAAAVAKDVWKLVLSRGNSAEGQAIRCYLLLGGEADAFAGTIATLRTNDIDLRWRNATGGGTAPARRQLNLKKLLQTKLGSDALESTLSWGAHFRQPPVCWERLVLSRRCEPWLRTLDGNGWRAVLFEVHHHGALNDQLLDTAIFNNGLKFTC